MSAPLTKFPELTQAKGFTAFECRCGRKQSYAPANKPGGITCQEALEIGWTRRQLLRGDTLIYDWKCPFCSGLDAMQKLATVLGGVRA
jgi:hypothetical protein